MVVTMFMACLVYCVIKQLVVCLPQPTATTMLPLRVLFQRRRIFKASFGKRGFKGKPFKTKKPNYGMFHLFFCYIPNVAYFYQQPPTSLINLSIPLFSQKPFKHHELIVVTFCTSPQKHSLSQSWSTSMHKPKLALSLTEAAAMSSHQPPESMPPVKIPTIEAKSHKRLNSEKITRERAIRRSGKDMEAPTVRTGHLNLAPLPKRSPAGELAPSHASGAMVQQS
jgi:hypothetical protein